MWILKGLIKVQYFDINSAAFDNILLYISDQEIERSYTPVQSFGVPSSSSSSSYEINLMIKLYSDGAMSKHLLNLQEGI